MGIELTLNQMIQLYQSASLGKLMNGLVHNLNGPLQNLGIDLEMVIHALKGHEPAGRALPERFEERLLRMEKELENINSLIRATALRADQDDSWLNQLNLGNYLEQELSFLNADLYFKHQVHKKIEIDPNLPPLSALPKHLPQALCWLLQLFLEELEKQKIKEFGLKVTAGQTGPQVIISMESKKLPHSFLALLEQNIPLQGALQLSDHDLQLAMVLAVIKSNGAELEIKHQPHKFLLIINLRQEYRVRD
ncbi:MAG: hypothetical protein EHM45_07150 [Desulfobacteraceae bacterium]|nr:MAG: hypothetical protein EHM45_07150 [Desulfobacteraceae bacterium]